MRVPADYKARQELRRSLTLVVSDDLAKAAKKPYGHVAYTKTSKKTGKISQVQAKGTKPVAAKKPVKAAAPSAPATPKLPKNVQLFLDQVGVAKAPADIMRAMGSLEYSNVFVMKYGHEITEAVASRQDLMTPDLAEEILSYALGNIEPDQQPLVLTTPTIVRILTAPAVQKELDTNPSWLEQSLGQVGSKSYLHTAELLARCTDPGEPDVPADHPQMLKYEALLKKEGGDISELPQEMMDKIFKQGMSQTVQQAYIRRVPTTPHEVEKVMLTDVPRMSPQGSLRSRFIASYMYNSNADPRVMAKLILQESRTGMFFMAKTAMQTALKHNVYENRVNDEYDYEVMEPLIAAMDEARSLPEFKNRFPAGLSEYDGIRGLIVRYEKGKKKVKKALVIDPLADLLKAKGDGRGRKKGSRNTNVKYIFRYMKPDGTWGYVRPDDYKDEHGRLIMPVADLVHHALMGNARIEKRKHKGSEYDKPVVEAGHFFTYHVGRKEEKDWEEVKAGERKKARKPGWEITPIQKMQGFLEYDWNPDYTTWPEDKIVITKPAPEPKAGRKLRDSKLNPKRKLKQTELEAEREQIIQLESANPFPKGDDARGVWKHVQQRKPRTMLELRQAIQDHEVEFYQDNEKLLGQSVQAFMDHFVENKCVQHVKGTIQSQLPEKLKEVMEKLHIKDAKQRAKFLKEIIRRKTEMETLPHRKAAAGLMAEAKAEVKQAPGAGQQKPAKYRGSKQGIHVVPVPSQLTKEAIAAPLSREVKAVDAAKDLLGVIQGPTKPGEKPLRSTKVAKYPVWVVAKFRDEMELVDQLQRRPATTMLTLGHNVKNNDDIKQIKEEWAGAIYKMAQSISGYTSFTTHGEEMKQHDEAQGKHHTSKDSAFNSYRRKVVSDLIKEGHSQFEEMVLHYKPSTSPNDRFDKYISASVYRAMKNAAAEFAKQQGLYVPLVDEHDEEDGNAASAVLTSKEIDPHEAAEHAQLDKQARGIIKRQLDAMPEAYRRVVQARLWLDEHGEEDERAYHEEDDKKYGLPIAQARRERQDKDDTWTRAWTGPKGIASKHAKWTDPVTGKRVNISKMDEKEQRTFLQGLYEEGLKKLRDGLVVHQQHDETLGVAERLTSAAGLKAPRRYTPTNEGRIVQRWLELEAKLSSNHRRRVAEPEYHQTVPMRREWVENRAHGWFAPEKGTKGKKVIKSTVIIKSFNASPENLLEAFYDLDFEYTRLYAEAA
jgi:hypothetical protein